MQEVSSFRVPDELPPLSYDETTWEWQIHTNYITYTQAGANTLWLGCCDSPQARAFVVKSSL